MIGKIKELRATVHMRNTHIWQESEIEWHGLKMCKLWITRYCGKTEEERKYQGCDGGTAQNGTLRGMMGTATNGRSLLMTKQDGDRVVTWTNFCKGKKKTNNSWATYRSQLPRLRNGKRWIQKIKGLLRIKILACIESKMIGKFLCGIVPSV